MSLVAEHYAQGARSSGYRHMSREAEKEMIRAVLNGETGMISALTTEALGANTLADDPVRSLKNNAICMVTVLGRAAIDEGADPERCFSVGDSYIIRLERTSDPAAVLQLTIDMLHHYARIVRETRVGRYSLPVLRAVRFIYNHLYEPFRLKDLADHLRLNPNYLSGIFRRETGLTPAKYIKRLRMEEARRLLESGEVSVTEIAGMLGYSSAGYFSRDFKKTVGVNARSYRVNPGTEGPQCDTETAQ